MCRAHAAVRQLLAGLLDERDVTTIIDMEAGLEHLSRGTARHVDTLLAVMEPYYKSLETARRCAELARELGIARTLAIANKSRNEADRTGVRDYAAAHDIGVIGEVPFDQAIWQADLSGHAPQYSHESPAVQAIELLATALGL